MKRWGIALLAVLLACVPLLLSHSSSPALLQDSDTAFLLKVVRERQAPWSWFAGDWPLGNHFYRPVSTLLFEMDNRLYGDNAAGYGWTNALLCFACVLLLLWFLRELTDDAVLSGAGSVVFALWHAGYGSWLNGALYAFAIVAALVGLWRHSLKVGYFLPAVLALLYLPRELGGVSPIAETTLHWLPGRTAVSMTVFALIALAAYARYERLSAHRDAARPTATDEPATKSTAQTQSKPRGAIAWALLCVVAVWLALSCYEQAVMLPAELFGVALLLRFQRYRVRWGWHAVFWAVLFAYLFVRSRLVPSDPSQYQLQQFRHGPGVYYSLADYLFPSLFRIQAALTPVRDGLVLLLTPQPWLAVLDIVANATTYWQAKRVWMFALGGWALSAVAYLPMAWLQQFGHYHYWPMAMRALLAVTLVWLAVKLAIIAASPPALRAPRRLAPAPGSLPRP